MKTMGIYNPFMEMMHAGSKRQHHEQELLCNYEGETGFGGYFNAIMDDEEDDEQYRAQILGKPKHVRNMQKWMKGNDIDEIQYDCSCQTKLESHSVIVTS